MVFEPFVAFARAALQAGTIGHPDDAAAGRDQIIGEEFLYDSIDRGALHAEQPGERLLR